MGRFALLPAISALFACAMACAPSPAKPAQTPVTVVMSGDERVATGVRKAIAAPSDLPLEVRFGQLPNAPPIAERAPSGEVEGALAAARRKYVGGSFAECLELIAAPALVPDLLARGRRTVAARVLFWRVACRVGAGASADATAVARELAVLGLEVPSDAEAAAPDVEALIARTIRQVQTDARVPLHITADVDRASVATDGRDAVCVTPCVVDLPVGTHVIAISADGVTPEARAVRVEGPRADVAFTMAPASPELAGQQWTRSYAHSAAVDSAASVHLLALSIRARKLALINVDAGAGTTVRLHGVLAVDGAVTARAERTAEKGAEVDGQGPSLLHDLLVQGNVVEPAPRLIARPIFWIAVGVVAAGAAVGTYFITRPPDRRTEVTF